MNLNGTDAACVAAAASRLRKGFTVIKATFNVVDEAAVVAAFERLDAARIALDIVVDNAGIQLRKKLVDFSARNRQGN